MARSKVTGTVAGKHATRGEHGRFVRSVPAGDPVPPGDPVPAPEPPAPAPAVDPAPRRASLAGRIWGSSLGELVHGPRS